MYIKKKNGFLVRVVYIQNSPKVRKITERRSFLEYIELPLENNFVYFYPQGLFSLFGKRNRT